MKRKKIDNLILRKEIDDLILYAKERCIFDVDRDIFSAIKKVTELFLAPQIAEKAFSQNFSTATYLFRVFLG